MIITVVRLKKFESGNFKAFADVSFDGVVVKGCRVMDGKNGLFATLPSQKGKDEKYYDTVTIEDKELKAEFVRVVLAEYNKVTPSDELARAAQDAGLINTQETPF